MSITKSKLIFNLGPSFDNQQKKINFPLLEDLNNDGKPDFLFSTPEIGSSVPEPLRLFLSQPDGTYVDASNRITSDFTSLWTQRIDAADLNNDGLMDVIIGAAPEQLNSRENGGIGADTDNHLEWGSEQYVLVQQSDGTFDPLRTIDFTYEAHSINVADFDNDGYQDILYVSDTNGGGNGQVPKLLLNNGDLTFSEADLSNLIGRGSLSDSFRSFWAAVGDVNNDSNIDIIFLNGGSDNGVYNFVALGNGDGTFTKTSLPKIPNSIGGAGATIEGDAVLDLDGDGNLDLLAWVIDRSDTDLGDLSPGHLWALIGDGAGGFSDQTDQWTRLLPDTIGSNTRSLGEYLPGTNLIPISFFLNWSGSGTGVGHLQEPSFLFNDGEKLIPVFHPYWNQEILNHNGFDFWGIQWFQQGGKFSTIYADWNENLVVAEFDPAGVTSLIKSFDQFLVVDASTDEVTSYNGFPYTASFYMPWVYPNQTDVFTRLERMLTFNTPGDRVVIGSETNQYIGAGNSYAATGANILVSGGGDDVLWGGSGEDLFLVSSDGDTYINGVQGRDTLVINKGFQSSSISGDEGLLRISFSEGAVVAENISTVVFADGTFSVSNGLFSGVRDAFYVDFWSNGSSLFDTSTQFHIADDARQTIAVSGFSEDFVVGVHSQYLKITRSDGEERVVVNGSRLEFLDKALAFDFDAHAGEVAKLLGAVFGADSVGNAEYVGIGLDLLDAGMSYTDLAALAVSVTGNSSSTDVCNLLWENVIGSPATSTDIAPFKAMLDSGQLGIGQLTTLAADTSFNTDNIDLIGLAQTGLEYL
ncbi:hypothetical protein GH816_02050 [Betaproteobacteria bacterium LSUCC0115]|nr:hypothetical protein [Burkholderiales bacterium LSUCC0115]